MVSVYLLLYLYSLLLLFVYYPVFIDILNPFQASLNGLSPSVVTHTAVVSYITINHHVFTIAKQGVCVVCLCGGVALTGSGMIITCHLEG